MDNNEILKLRKKIVERIKRQLARKNIKGLLKDYNSINGVLFEIISVLHLQDQELPVWQPYLEVHLTKYAYLNSSLIKEFGGINAADFENKPLKTYNISVLYLLQRSQMETFFIINYLYFNYKSEEQAKFRYILYERSGLSQRQLLMASEPHNKIKKADEKVTVDALTDLMLKNEYFLTLHPKKQSYIKSRTDAKEIGWAEIIDECGINKEYHHQTWGVLSNYAHSESIEAMQLASILNDKSETTQRAYLALVHCMSYTGMLIKKLFGKYTTIQNIINSQPPNLIVTLELWGDFALGLKFNNEETDAS